MEIFRVLKSGPQTQVQDLGRYGYLQYGVPPCGVLDQYSSRVANLLAGNSGNEALLEITFQGPRLEVLGRAMLAVAGADMAVTLNGETRPGWTSFSVRPGDILNIGQAKRGLRAYLAVTGGIDVPLIMGSRSTYSAAGFGGYQGRALAWGDILARGGGPEGKAGISCPAEFIPPFTSETVLRAIPGPQDYMFEEGLATFFGSTYEVTPHSNRMGYRLEGPAIALDPDRPQSIISEPSLPGGVQAPADGKPIILLLEQTTGGYAKIATVISTDICRVAQARPGDRVSFARVSLEEAHGLFKERESRLKKLAGQLRKIA